MKSSRFGWVVWYAETATAILAQCFALSLLLRKPKKKVSDLLLSQLFLSELVYILWTLTFYLIEVFSGKLSIPGETVAYIGEILIGYFICQSVFWVTTDRVLAVRIGLKYKVFVTKSKYALAAAITCVISIVHSFLAWILAKRTVSLVMVVWDSIMMFYILSSYIYIIIAVHIHRKRLSISTSTVTHRRFTYEVPFVIALSFIFLVELQNQLGFFVKFQQTDHVWLHVAWFANFNVDPVCYLFYSRGLLKRLFCCTSIPKSTPPECMQLRFHQEVQNQEETNHNENDYTF